MLIGAELAAWLGDPERQQAGRRASEAFARRWSRLDFTQNMRRALDALEVKTADGVLAVAQHFLDRTDDLRMLIGALIPEAASNPFFRPPLAPVSSDIAVGFILYDEPSVTLSVAVTSADALAVKKSSATGPRSIKFSGLGTAFHFIKSGGATLSLWEAPAIDRGLSGELSGKCRAAGRRKMEDGDRIVLDGSRESFVIEHVEGDMVCLQAVVHAGSAPLAVEYDSRTLEYVGASSTDEAASRLQIMVGLLRVMERNDAIPVIEQLLRDSPHFYTRWQLMRELLAMDAEAALPSLRRLAETDPHPEVRAAADQTLELFFGEDDEGLAACRG